MTIILVICAVIVTLAFTALAAQAILTLRQVRNTAGAIEALALNADGKLAALDPMVKAAHTLANGVSSGWFHALRLVYGLISRRNSDQ